MSAKWESVGNVSYSQGTLVCPCLVWLLNHFEEFDKFSGRWSFQAPEKAEWIEVLLKGKVKKSQKKKKPRNVSFAFTRIADICQYLQLPAVVYFFQAGVKIPSTKESTEET